MNKELLEVLVACDSELSAQGHGRPASDKEELLALSGRCRKLYESIAKMRPGEVLLTNK